jgi:hypothetical protein
MRVLVGCFGLLSLVAMTQQTSDEFRSRYGNPDVEQFVVRPHVTLTAEYGLDGRACRLRIQPVPDPSLERLDQSAPSMEEAMAVLDEIVPPETRGKPVELSERVSPQCHGAALPSEYENARIDLYYGLCDKVPTVHGIEVYFKRPACETAKK